MAYLVIENLINFEIENCKGETIEQLLLSSEQKVLDYKKILSSTKAKFNIKSESDSLTKQVRAYVDGSNEICSMIDLNKLDLKPQEEF